MSDDLHSHIHNQTIRFFNGNTQTDEIALEGFVKMVEIVRVEGLYESNRGVVPQAQIDFEKTIPHQEHLVWGERRRPSSVNNLRDIIFTWEYEGLFPARLTKYDGRSRGIKINCDMYFLEGRDWSIRFVWARGGSAFLHADKLIIPWTPYHRKIWGNDGHIVRPEVTGFDNFRRDLVYVKLFDFSG